MKMQKLSGRIKLMGNISQSSQGNSSDNEVDAYSNESEVSADEMDENE